MGTKQSEQITIKELERTFKNLPDLIQYVVMQNAALMYATTKIAQLEDRVKNPDTQIITSSSTTRIVRSIPEALCQLEIDRLMTKAANAPLDLEDTKRLDLLIKNYYIAKEKELPEAEKKKSLGDIVITDETLTSIAAQENK